MTANDNTIFKVVANIYADTDFSVIGQYQPIYRSGSGWKGIQKFTVYLKFSVFYN